MVVKEKMMAYFSEFFNSAARGTRSSILHEENIQMDRVTIKKNIYLFSLTLQT